MQNIRIISSWIFILSRWQHVKKSKSKHISQVIKPQYIFIGSLAAVLALSGILLSQKNKMDEIIQEQAALDEKYAALQAEEQRVGRMIEYVQTDEYLIQYAREKLGYVFSDDIKFYRDNAD